MHFSSKYSQHPFLPDKLSFITGTAVHGRPSISGGFSIQGSKKACPGITGQGCYSQSFHIVANLKMFLRETHLGETATQDAPQSLEAVKRVSCPALLGGWAWGRQGQGVARLSEWRLCKGFLGDPLQARHTQGLEEAVPVKDQDVQSPPGPLM